MKILIVDDEPGALHLLEENVRRTLPLANIHSFGDPAEALAWGLENKPYVAFLDIQLGSMDGIELGRRLKDNDPTVNLIFVTAYLEYAYPAHHLRASGFLEKPATQEAVARELEDLRYPMPKPPTAEHLTVQCFGSFEVFYDGKPLRFARSKTKELFALLVDGGGAWVTTDELCKKLWDEGEAKQAKDYLRHLVSDLKKTLAQIDKADVLIRSRSAYSINPRAMVCDLYDYRNNIPYAVRAYTGVYMKQYPWAEHKEIH